MAANKDALLVKEARKRLEKNPALTSDVNANRIFKEYQELGLIPKKYKVKEHFLNAVAKVAREDKVTAKKAADKIIKLNAFSNRKNLGPRVIDFIKNKVKYEGIPLELDSSGKARFAKRRFHGKPPKQLEAYIKKLEATNQLPKGYFEDFAKYAKESWKEAGNKIREYSEKIGITGDTGHLIPAAEGGPSVGMNQRWEKAFGPGGNRSKGATPNFKTPDIPNELGIPDTWTRAFYEYDLDRQGLSATGLPIGKSLTDADIAKIELGANPDQVVANRQKLGIPKNGNGTNGTNGTHGIELPDSHKKIVEKLKSGAYTQPTPTVTPSKNKKILGIIPKNKKVVKAASLLTIGSLAGLGVLGTAASAADTKQRWDKAKQTGNPLDYVQSGLSAASTATGWSGVGEVIATPADLANLYIDGLRSKKNGEMSTEERRRAIDSLKFIK